MNALHDRLRRLQYRQSRPPTIFIFNALRPRLTGWRIEASANSPFACSDLWMSWGPKRSLVLGRRSLFSRVRKPTVCTKGV
jgi:hypothetical protein